MSAETFFMIGNDLKKKKKNRVDRNVYSAQMSRTTDSLEQDMLCATHKMQKVSLGFIYCIFLHLTSLSHFCIISIKC